MGSKSNNFDLIRLVAASQVAIVHSFHFQMLTPERSLAMLHLNLFPGVPIFFFVSGFLISQSFEKNPSIIDFAWNRCLRIYPALIVCFVVSVLSVFLTGYFRIARVDWFVAAGWAAAQLSFLQFYNPNFMRHYGTGVLDGSLWTISVELQFYVLTPVIHRLVRAKLWGGQNGRWFALILLFIVANRIYALFTPTLDQSILYKLVGVTFIPWFYMFLAGAFVQHNFSYFHSKLAGKVLIVFIPYVAIALCAERWLGWGFGNLLNPISYVGLVLVIFAAAFSYPSVSDKILGRNDISYGVYIYHMPVINLLLATGAGGSIEGFWVAMSTTFALAIVSWILVEKPALEFKRHPLYRHSASVG
ncbi:MAG TPA: acyltransferase [Bryobacteraceae bacterium]|nr:acyltransferase [Bryobacteraceae bacterium]